MFDQETKRVIECANIHTYIHTHNYLWAKFFKLSSTVAYLIWDKVDKGQPETDVKCERIFKSELK